MLKGIQGGHRVAEGWGASLTPRLQFPSEVTLSFLDTEFFAQRSSAVPLQERGGAGASPRSLGRESGLHPPQGKAQGRQPGSGGSEPRAVAPSPCQTPRYRVGVLGAKSRFGRADTLTETRKSLKSNSPLKGIMRGIPTAAQRPVHGPQPVSLSADHSERRWGDGRGSRF